MGALEPWRGLDGLTYGHTDTRKFSPWFFRTSYPAGPLPKNPQRQTGTESERQKSVSQPTSQPASKIRPDVAARVKLSHQDSLRLLDSVTANEV